MTRHQGAEAAEIVLDRRRHRLSVISPGAALCSPGQGSQPSLASLTADPYQVFWTTEAKQQKTVWSQEDFQPTHVISKDCVETGGLPAHTCNFNASLK